jgi:hypothetical protein
MQRRRKLSGVALNSTKKQENELLGVTVPAVRAGQTGRIGV